MLPTRNIPCIKPPALRPGDTIGIIAPASNIKRALLEAGCEALRTLGYNPFYLDSILDKDLYFAGAAERRARELDEITWKLVKGIDSPMPKLRGMMGVKDDDD